MPTVKPSSPNNDPQMQKHRRELLIRHSLGSLCQIGKMRLSVAARPDKINESRFASLKFDF
jgi:hypothetical protein